ncbi:hypothetical protein HOY80DRAFT_1133179 [Tuber brumale]|nr:hypothetical protein HOY80DRAFT_1133179 [Tuber brumale]
MLHHSRTLASFSAALRPFLPHVSTLPGTRQILRITTPKFPGSMWRTWSSDTHATTPLVKYKAELQERLANAEADNDKLIGKLSAERAERLRLEEHFNLRGAIERVVRQANALGKIKISVDIQPEIDEMAKLQRFKTVLDKQVEARRLVPRDVKICVRHAYHEVSKHTHGNDITDATTYKDCTASEAAVLDTLLRVPEKWSKRIPGEEEPAPK